MKIKMDFVTNSSSSSFIVVVESDTKDLEEFIQKFNEFLRDHIEENSWKDDFEPPGMLTYDRVKKVGPNTFIVKDFLPFYWDEKDMPSYIKVLKKFREGDDQVSLIKYGIKKVSVDVRDLNENTKDPSDSDGDL